MCGNNIAKDVGVESVVALLTVVPEIAAYIVEQLVRHKIWPPDSIQDCAPRVIRHVRLPDIAI